MSQEAHFEETCPSCGEKNTMIDGFTCCGIVLGVMLFPIGLICCLLMREKKCARCGNSPKKVGKVKQNINPATGEAY